MSDNIFGISSEDVDLIVANREFILKNRDKDPFQLALKGVNSVICTQIRYLIKCEVKMPLFSSIGAIIPPLSYEQSSSELSILTRGYSGDNCLDLTCGLGVDSYCFSKTFKKVISIERDNVLFKVASHNFNLLNCSNIELLNEDSELFVSNYNGKMFDMVYIDPARRNNEDKVFSFEQSSPNVIELLPILRKITKRIVIKSSPMFDNDKAFELFGDGVSLKTVSVMGECKELIIDISENNIKKDIVSIINRVGDVYNYTFSNYPHVKCNDVAIVGFVPKYVLVPDVGFIKNRRVGDLFKSLMPHNADYIVNNSVAISDVKLSDNSLRCYEIDQIFEYKPKIILQYLKKRGIKSSTIMIKNFSYDISSIKKSLKLKDGTNSSMIATRIAGIDSVIFCKKVF